MARVWLVWPLPKFLHPEMCLLILGIYLKCEGGFHGGQLEFNVQLRFKCHLPVLMAVHDL